MHKLSLTLINWISLLILSACTSAPKFTNEEKAKNFFETFPATHLVTFGQEFYEKTPISPRRKEHFLIGQKYSTFSKSQQLATDGFCENKKQSKPFFKSGTIVIPNSPANKPLDVVAKIKIEQKDQASEKLKRIFKDYYKYYSVLDKNQMGDTSANVFKEHLSKFHDYIQQKESNGVVIIDSYIIKNSFFNDFNTLKKQDRDQDYFQLHRGVQSYVPTYIEKNDDFVLSLVYPSILSYFCKELGLDVVNTRNDCSIKVTEWNKITYGPTHQAIADNSRQQLQSLFFRLEPEFTDAKNDVSYLQYVRYKDLESIFDNILLIPKDEQIKLFGEAFGYVHDQLAASEVIAKKDAIWEKYLEKFTYVQEDQTDDPQIIKVRVGLDLNDYCAYSRSNDSFHSK